MLNTSYLDLHNAIPYGEIIYTGPIDDVFRLSLRQAPISFYFVRVCHPRQARIPAGAGRQLPIDYAYTRCTEFKYLTGQEHAKTTVVYEYPPPRETLTTPSRDRKTRALSEIPDAGVGHTKQSIFAGRLGTYKYYNMDQVVAQALTLYASSSRRIAVSSAAG